MYTFKSGDSFYYFVVTRVLGAGLHGQVYEIRHRETGDLFALKTIHAADCADPRKIARALAGAKGNYRIDHRNVVKVLDLNCEASGLVWMRTELLRGHTVQELLAVQGRFSLPFALAAATEAAFGLCAVHDAQIVHRDVKPSNLFFTVDRAIKVIDLSLAKVFPEGLETTVGKRVGLGTPAYSAPEQLEGQVQPDVRVDVYGLGITLWEMLAGRNPYQHFLNNVPELIKRQLTEMPPLLADIARLPPQVDAVVRRAIEKDPAKRYGSMMEMARALMDLSAWVSAEARAGRLLVVVPQGEPALPGDANTWRDYRPPVPPPVADPPAAPPSARVILAEPTQAARLLAETLPMPENPLGGLAGTLPLDEVSAEAVPGPTPAAFEASAKRSAARTGRRLPWALVLAAALMASLCSVALVVWLVRREAARAEPQRAPVAATAAPVAPSATEKPPPAPTDKPTASSAPTPPSATPPSSPSSVAVVPHPVGLGARRTPSVAPPLPTPRPVARDSKHRAPFQVEY